MHRLKITQLSIFDHTFNEILKMIPVDDELKKMDTILTDNPELIELTRLIRSNGRAAKYRP